MCSISIIVTETIKNGLKLIFGRTWPETWIENNPSFIHDGVYGFNFLHGGTAYQSFPSGHMAAACAAVSVLWIWYPRLKWLWAVIRRSSWRGARWHELSFSERRYFRCLCRCIHWLDDNSDLESERANGAPSFQMTIWRATIIPGPPTGGDARIATALRAHPSLCLFSNGWSRLWG